MVRVGYKKYEKVKVQKKSFRVNIFFLQQWVYGYLKIIVGMSSGGGGGCTVDPLSIYCIDIYCFICSNRPEYA